MEEKTKAYKNRGELVFETLKREILDLELKPGQMISENEICERFGVSRTPVREAVRRLQEQGFVISVPYSGTQVTLLNLSNIKQMIYMRVAVETMVMRDFVDIATPLWMEEVRYMIRKQQALIQEKGFEPEGDLEAYLGRLDGDTQTIIRLRFFEELSLAEIARITELNLNTVKARLYRGLKRLRIDIQEVGL